MEKIVEFESRRLNVRHNCLALECQINGFIVDVNDLNLEGFSFNYEAGKLLLAENSNESVTLLDKTTRDASSFAVIYIGSETNKEKERHRFKFTSPRRPEGIGWLNRHLSNPAPDSKSSRVRFNHQKNLAESDISSQQTIIQSLKDRQFQLVFAAIPILFGLIASSTAIFMKISSGKAIHEFYYILPPASGILSFLFLAVFVQKIESVRRSSAFSLVLQRHIAMGIIPACYRGWHDALENYNHIIRYGAKEGSVFDVEPFTDGGRKHWVAASSFNYLAFGLFVAIQIISLALNIGLIYLEYKSSALELSGYTGFVSVISICCVYAAWRFYKKYVALTKGKRSYRYMVVLFSKILKYAPPYDPYRTKQLMTHDRPKNI